MSDSLHDRVVAAIGEHYELEGEIGRGGMSVVYRARDRRLNRPVAIKVLPPELAHDQAIRARFTREAQTSAQLSHTHIVPIYDVGELRRQNLDRDWPVQAAVAGAVDDGHAAAANFVLELVLLADCGEDAVVQRVGHSPL